MLDVAKLYTTFVLHAYVLRELAAFVQFTTLLN